MNNLTRTPLRTVTLILYFGEFNVCVLRWCCPGASYRTVEGSSSQQAAGRRGISGSSIVHYTEHLTYSATKRALTSV